MRVLHIVSSWSTSSRSYSKPFIVSQINSLMHNGIVIDILNLNATDHTLNYITGIFKVLKKIHDKDYDVVHAHYSYNAWPAILQRRVPVIVSFMGNDLFGVLNGRGGQKLVGYFNIFTSTLLINFVDAVIVKSNRMKELINASHVFVVPNGVDFRSFEARKRRPASDEAAVTVTKKILFLGDPENPRKNFPLALKAVELLRKDYPKAELTVPFGLPPQRVSDVMNTADVLLFTSLQEGSPNVIKEAMACNLPIVATDVGDVREVISNTEGCYVTSFETEDVADKLKKALAWGKRTNGRENIMHLEINFIAKKIISVYEYALGRKRGIVTNEGY
jgi:teichuronic acid biosynthesis glycosyltransferase TuaC